MTQEQRQEAIRDRWRRGHPLHAPPHPFRGEGRYLLTAANYEHAEIIARPERRTAFERRLVTSMEAVGAEVFAWVVLPNHYHILVGVENLRAISDALERLHGATSREWNVADGLTGKRRVWYKFTDRLMRDEAHFYRALNYVHANPLKHRCVDDVYEWAWSSLHSYCLTHGRETLRENWRKYPPDRFDESLDG